MAKKSKKEFYQNQILEVLQKNKEVKVLDITNIIGDYNYPKMMILTHDLCAQNKMMRIGRGDSVKWVEPTQEYLEQSNRPIDLEIDMDFSKKSKIAHVDTK